MTKKLTKKQLEEARKKRNAAFWKMSKQRRRIAIAKDVLLQIEMKRLSVERGRFFYGYGSVLGYDDDVKLDVALEKAPKGREACRVCALGACLVGMANLGDRLTIRQADIGGSQRNKILELLSVAFDKEQCGLIECTFEGQLYDEYKDLISWNESSPCRYIKRLIPDAEERLKLIMQNIVKNKGEYKPEELLEEIELENIHTGDFVE